MVKKILGFLAVIIIVLVIVISMKPSQFKVTRPILISAPASTVFAQVNDFHNWQAWSPWAKLDPNAKAIYEGPAAGEGAIFRWAGNNQVGEGSQTIVETRANERILIKLDFLKPFKAVNYSEFTFTPQGNQTLVIWSMFGKNNFMGKVMSVFMNCEKMVGGQFEKGLERLKIVSESMAK